MKTQFQTFNELARAVDAARRTQRDLIVNTEQHLRVTDDAQLEVKDEGLFSINPHAHRQIGGRTKIPAIYYDYMLREAPDLLAFNVNHHFEHKPERRMARFQNGHLRAFLSDRYQRIDNWQVLEKAILPALRKHASDLVYHSLALTGERMYVKAILPTVRAEVQVGEIVEAGIEFRNGEIGNSRFEAWPFMYKLTCKNGARFETGGFKKLHIGARADVSDEVYEMLTDETIRIDDQAFMLKVRDMVAATLEQRSFNKLVDKARQATQQKITGNPAAAVQVLGDSFDMNDDERGSILRHLIEGGDLSKWGVANAVTRAAQDLESYDRSDEFEGFGGKIIELQQTEWVRLAEAA